MKSPITTIDIGLLLGIFVGILGVIYLLSAQFSGGEGIETWSFLNSVMVLFSSGGFTYFVYRVKKNRFSLKAWEYQEITKEREQHLKAMLKSEKVFTEIFNTMRRDNDGVVTNMIFEKMWRLFAKRRKERKKENTQSKSMELCN